MRHRVTSLFSGIGGFEAGFRGSEFDVTLMCEVDPAAQAVLRARFPDSDLVTDVTTLKSLPACDVLVGGWPCQDLSQAGRTAGIGGLRSSLVGEVFRLIDTCTQKPGVILLENVAFALSLDKGRAVKQVVRELEARGYHWAYRVLDTREFGLPQRRRRIFICASQEGVPWSLLCDGPAKPREEEPDPSHVGFYWTEGNRGVGWTADAVPPLKGGSSLSIPSPPAIWDTRTGEFRVPTIEDAERLQGFPANWTLPAASVTGNDRARWRLVGNAVSVPVARWLGARLSESKRALAEWPTLGAEIERTHNAAYGGPGRQPRFITRYQEGPADPIRRTLADIEALQFSQLSERAAGGFLSRYEKSKLAKRAEFVEALQAYCELFNSKHIVVPAYTSPET